MLKLLFVSNILPNTIACKEKIKDVYTILVWKSERSRPSEESNFRWGIILKVILSQQNMTVDRIYQTRNRVW